MDEPLSTYELGQRITLMRRPKRRSLTPKFGKAGLAANRDRTEEFAVVSEKMAVSSLAEPHHLFEHSVEHRREVAGRAVDDLQYLGGRGLLLKRFARLGDQPRVLHRDHRLIGKGAHQVDLPLGERLVLVAPEI